jgi:hypothetical protein
VREPKPFEPTVAVVEVTEAAEPEDAEHLSIREIAQRRLSHWPNEEGTRK